VNHVCIHALFLAGAVALSTPAEPPPPIKLPVAPAVPAIMPPAPAPVTALSPDTLYVIECQTDCILRAHPAGLVRVVKESGPLRVRAKFADGAGKVETRSFIGKSIFLVEAVGTGRVEIDVIPLGLKSETEIVTATVDVDSGHGPIPPPTPKVDPKVDPAPAPATGLRVLFIRETGKALTPAQHDVVFSPKIEEYLDRKCAKDTKGRPEWRRWDPDMAFADSTSPTMKQLFADTKPKLGALPQLLIVNDKAGQLYSLPATEAEALALLKQYGGE
jgi:hypothetical protein